MSPVRIQLPLPDTRFSYDTWGSPAVVDDVLLAVVAKPCIIWPVGQAVKTSPFHGGNPGSIPGRVTRKPADAKASAGFPFSLMAQKKAAWESEPKPLSCK